MFLYLQQEEHRKINSTEGGMAMKPELTYIQSCSPICGRFRKPLSADWSRSWTDCWHSIQARTKQLTSLAGCSTGTV